MTEREAPRECANCGAEIPRGAKACPECGADERTGWRETSIYDDLDLPDSAFDEDEPNSASRRSPKRVNGIAWYWWLVGLAIIVVLLAKWLI